MPRHPNGETREKILDFVEKYTEQNGFAPSVREIADAVDLRSTATVYGHLNRLEKQGLLHKNPMKPRTVGVSKGEKVSLRAVPVLGKTGENYAILDTAYAANYEMLPETMTGNGECFVLVMDSDEMTLYGVLRGDHLVVRRQLTALGGDLVVALLAGSVVCCRYSVMDGNIYLTSHKGTIPMEENMLIGRVIMVYRRYGG